MRREGLAAVVLLAALLVGSGARADDAPSSSGTTSTPASAATSTSGTTFLPGAARAIPRTTSASRDTAVLEYAYGPRAQASIGFEPGLLVARRASTTFHLGLYAMAGLENASNGRVFPPGEVWRGLVGVSFALELPRLARASRLARAWLVPGSDLEVGLIVGHESDHETAASSPALAPPGPYAIAFGGGGDFVEPDVAVWLPAGRALTITVRLRDRIYFNELPLLVGVRSLSDDIADGLHEGLLNAPGADLVVRWKAARWAMPQLALFGEHLFPHDPFAAEGQFFRAMAGVVLRGRRGEVEPFASFDGGNGKGLLVQERALRLSVGVRYAPF
jgi:hypothetical protein